MNQISVTDISKTQKTVRQRLVIKIANNEVNNTCFCNEARPCISVHNRHPYSYIDVAAI